jgi:hypothetical protein
MNRKCPLRVTLEIKHVRAFVVRALERAWEVFRGCVFLCGVWKGPRMSPYCVDRAYARPRVCTFLASPEGFAQGLYNVYVWI